jgi:hypothetical protein
MRDYSSVRGQLAAWGALVDHQYGPNVYPNYQYNRRMNKLRSEVRHLSQAKSALEGLLARQQQIGRQRYQQRRYK